MQIETIDYRRLAEPDTQQQLARACQQAGFFALSHHGLEALRKDDFLHHCTSFFQAPKAAKLALERSAENPFGFYDKELTKNQPDWKEVFDISLSEETPTRWPSDPAFVQQMTAWSEACHEVAMQLLGAIFNTLDFKLEPEFFAPEHTSFLRLNYYPPCPAPATDESEGAFGVSHHTDAGALTLLQQDSIAGLQFLVDGQWLTAPANPEVLMVNLGDMLQVWSNDKYQAPLHRVLASSDTERYSAPYFLNPAYSCDCAPLTSDTPKYGVVNWGEFRRGRADGDFADYGEEIQISQYRL